MGLYPEEVSDRYPDTDLELLRDCWILVLAMVASWRWDPGDQSRTGDERPQTSSARPERAFAVAGVRRHDALTKWAQASRQRRSWDSGAKPVAPRSLAWISGPSRTVATCLSILPENVHELGADLSWEGRVRNDVEVRWECR